MAWLYIPAQDGRGMGLPFKLATLLVREQLKIDTVEAARAVAEHMNIDVRSCGGSVAILKFFGIPEETPVRLVTNNPKKIIAFAENGYRTTELLAVIIPPTEHTLLHLAGQATGFGTSESRERAHAGGAMQ